MINIFTIFKLYIILKKFNKDVSGPADVVVVRASGTPRRDQQQLCLARQASTATTRGS
jgi:hypothetical protein